MVAPVMPGFAPRMDRIEGSATVRIANLVAEKKAAGEPVIGFSVGEPDFDTPDHVKAAAKAALDAGHTKYTPGPGIPALREAVARYHQERNGIPCRANNVLVTPTKQAVAMSLLALVDQGDEVILPDPAWVSYAPITQWAHADPVPVTTTADEGFRLTPDGVAEAITPNTKVVLLNSPSNPTGGVATPDDVRGIVDLAVDHDLWIISDEIYQEIIYDAQHQSPAALEGAFERTITLDGLSKSFAMTGWRLGWLVAPEPAFKQINKLQSHSITCCTNFAQHGGVAALNGPRDFLADMVDTFRARRDRMVERLNAIEGVTCPVPGGAFYVFPHFDADVWGSDDNALCERLIAAGIAPTPGSAFGAAGKGHLRFSYATSMENIETGMDVLEGLKPTVA